MSKTKTKWIEDDAITKEKLNSDVAGEGIAQAAGGELDLDINGLTNTETTIDDADLLAIYEQTNSRVEKITRANFLAGVTDDVAIHDNVAAEISAVTEKVTPVSADLLLMEDSADSNNKKRVQIGNLPGGGGGDDILVNSVAATDGNFNDTTPAAVGSGTNVKWQKDTTAPDNISAYLQESTETQRGAIEIATHTETDTGTDDTKAVTPDKLANTTVNGIDGTAIHDNVNSEINAIATKSTLAASDIFLLEDSAASYAKKKASLYQLWNFAPLILWADHFDNPNNSDWAVNSLARASGDSNNAGVNVRRFDDSTEEGVGWTMVFPAGVASFWFTTYSRAEVGAASNLGVAPALYAREFLNNAAVESWSSRLILPPIVMGTSNEYFQYDTTTVSLSTLGIVTGRPVQLELTRYPGSGSDTLVDDWTLLGIKIEMV